MYLKCFRGRAHSSLSDLQPYPWANRAARNTSRDKGVLKQNHIHHHNISVFYRAADIKTERKHDNRSRFGRRNLPHFAGATARVMIVASGCSLL